MQGFAIRSDPQLVQRVLNGDYHLDHELVFVLQLNIYVIRQAISGTSIDLSAPQRS